MNQHELAYGIEPSMPIGLVKHHLAAQGITDLPTIAGQIEALKRSQSNDAFYSYDGYTESGSATHARINDGRNERDCVVWSINHYLGLNRNPRVIERAKEALDAFGTGCGTSAMSGGRSALHKELEDRLARMGDKERVLLFPTGYTANAGAISGLVGKNDLILSDRENHASVIEGCRGSRARIVPFEHNSVEDLERKLEELAPQHENVLVVVESAYSMSGDLAPLREIAALKKRHDFLLYVDEAHTFGFYGEAGRGYCHELGVADDVDFLMATLSKATASIGGFVAMDDKYATMLTYEARSYMFQACFPPADAAVVLAALDEIESNPAPIRRLHENNAHFRRRLESEGFDLGTSESPVVPVFISDFQKLRAVTTDLFDAGIYTVSVMYPAIGMDEGRLRFIVSAAHTSNEIEHTVAVLARICRRHGVLPPDGREAGASGELVDSGLPHIGTRAPSSRCAA